MSAIMKSGSRILAIAGLAIGISALGFAQSESSSVVGTIKNLSEVNNTAPTVVGKFTGGGWTNGGHNGGHNGGGNGGHNGGGNGGHNGGGNGGHNGGGNGGHNGGGNPPPNCVPEPASMLIMGAGAGYMALKRYRAKKA